MVYGINQSKTNNTKKLRTRLCEQTKTGTSNNLCCSYTASQGVSLFMVNIKGFKHSTFQWTKIKGTKIVSISPLLATCQANLTKEIQPSQLKIWGRMLSPSHFQKRVRNEVIITNYVCVCVFQSIWRWRDWPQMALSIDEGSLNRHQIQLLQNEMINV